MVMKNCSGPLSKVEEEMDNMLYLLYTAIAETVAQRNSKDEERNST